MATVVQAVLARRVFGSLCPGLRWVSRLRAWVGRLHDWVCADEVADLPARHAESVAWRAERRERGDGRAPQGQSRPGSHVHPGRSGLQPRAARTEQLRGSACHGHEARPAAGAGAVGLQQLAICASIQSSGGSICPSVLAAPIGVPSGQQRRRTSRLAHEGRAAGGCSRLIRPGSCLAGGSS